MSRHVRTLHLTAPTAPLARRGAFLVEDALRTASFAGGQRLVLIRRLDVGKVDPRRPPATVAMALERAWQSLAGQWVYADSPTAETAPIVWFQDAVEPYRLFAQQIAQGKTPTAWFWRKAIPAEVVEDPAPLRRLLFTLIERQGLLAAATFIGDLHQRNVLLPLLEQLRPADGDLLWSFYPPSSSSATPLPFPVSHFPFPLSAVPSWNHSDPRTLWLAATLLIYEKPARLAAPYLRPMAEVVTANAFTPLHQVSDKGDHKGAPLQNENLRPASRIPPHNGDVVGSQRLRPASRVLPDLPPTESDPEGVYSEYAGLFLLINVLDRLGMGRWCAAMPELIEGDFPTRVLRHLVRLVQPHRTFHPQTTGIPHAATMSPPLTGVERHIEQWFGAEEPVTTGGDMVAPHEAKRNVGWDDHHQYLSLWTILVRRWLARHLRYDLATLVRRPGRVVWTRTHVDVIFDERQVDLAIRMAGVDIDPGWVPWWGRVVKFHYEAMGKS